MRLPLRNLVGVVTRSVADPLALEGLDRADADASGIEVVLAIPEKVPTEPVPADQLARPDTAEHRPPRFPAMTVVDDVVLVGYLDDPASCRTVA